jgi:hypothetical protein
MSTKGFDLSNLSTIKKAEEGAVLEVLHPANDTRLGIRITLAGEDSEVYRSFVNKQANKLRQKVMPGRAYVPPPVEKDQEQATDLLAACTLGWEGMVMNGKPYPFTRENAKALYSNPGFAWLRNQVDKFIADRANFLA